MATNITNKDLQQNVFQEGGTHDAAPVTYRPVRPVLPIGAIVTPGATLPQNSVATVKSELVASTSSSTDAVNEMVFRGIWKNFITYNINDVVIFNGSAYLAILTNVNAQPDLNHDAGVAEGSQNGSAVWTLLSENFVFGASATPSLATGGLGPFDNSVSSVGNSSSVQLIGTPSYSNEIAIVAIGAASSGNTITMPAGWQLLYNNSGSTNQQFFYKILSNRSTLSVNATLSISEPWAAYMAFFQFGGFVTANITSIQILTNTLTVTCSNTLAAGNWVVLNGLTNATFLNGALLQVATANSAQFTVSYTHAAYGPTADTGTASLVIQQATSQSSGSFSTPRTVTFANPTKKGSVLAFALWSAAAEVVSSPVITDGGFNTYQTPLATVFGPGPSFGGATSMGAFSTPNAGGPTSITVSSATFTDHNGVNQPTLPSSEWYGVEFAGSASTGHTFIPYNVFEFRGSFFVCLKETNLDAYADPTSWGQIAQGTGYIDFLSGTSIPNLQDYGRLIENNTSSNFAVNLPATPPSNSWWAIFQNSGTGSITINPGSLLLDGSSANLVLGTNQGVAIFTDGQNYYTFRGLVSVSLTMPSEFVVSGSPGMNLVVTKANEPANTIASGPASGSPAPWSFRAAVPADLPPLAVAVASGVNVAVSQNGTLRIKGAVVPAGVYRVAAAFLVSLNPGAGNLDINIGWNDGVAARTATNGTNGMPADISTAALNFAQGETILIADGVHDITWAMTLT
jgi:hypothetical protein